MRRALFRAQSAKAELKTLLDPETRWIELLSESQLKGDSHNLFAIGNPGRFTHLRLRIFPDGGVARLRVHGQVVPAPLGRVAKPIDLVAIENGGSVVSSSDQFFGTPLNMLMPGTSLNMGDGWETRRRRGPGYDWAIVKLGMPGRIERAEVNTAHFKGNFPDSCSIEVLNAPETSGSSDNGIAEADSWTTLLPQTKLKAHHRHFFTRELRDAGVATHVRLNIYPDGGVGRLRLYGVPELASDPIARFNAMPRMAARKALLDCCGSRKWVAKMLAGRPFESLGSILKMADEIWAALKPSDWLEAFRHHPPIGGKKAKAAQSSAAKRWSSGEQSAAQQSSDATLRELAEGNVKYHEKFGHVFLICATGRSGDEILAALRRRIENDAKTELHIAAEEQRQITRLRLEKLLR